MDILISLAAISLVAWVVKYLTSSSRSLKSQTLFPPGPKPKFLIGNALDLPGSNPAQEYVAWGKTYNSDILHASALGTHIVVLNKREDVDELLEKRAAIYSSRPTLPLIPMLGWEWNLALMAYGHEWRVHRKLCQQNFRQDAAPTYNPVQVKKVNKMLQALLDSPEKHEEHTKMFSVSIPMALMYGYDVESVDDPCIEAADRSVSLGAQLLIPGGSMINVFPFLRHIPAWFPGASSHKIAAEVTSLTNEMVRIPTDFIKQRMREGTAPPSLVSNFLEKKETVGATEHEEFVVTNIAYTIYSAAGDTTISAVGTLIYALATHPHVQRKAQQEIDSIIGSSRLPNLEDRGSLPYIEATYREIMRWRPPLPVAVPHTSTEDNYYKGYFIPKGTAVFGNVWAMAHDPAVYTEPAAFNPDRFFDENGQLNDDDYVLAYGFGRRICVGRHVASSTLWLLLVSILATFDIGKAKDEFGAEIEINDDYEDFGLIRHKKHFPCSIKPRSPHSKRLIEDLLDH